MRLFELLDKSGQRIQLIGLGGDVFREATSGLIRVIDHELVIRFCPDVPERLRRNILRPHGFVVCQRMPSSLTSWSSHGLKEKPRERS